MGSSLGVVVFGFVPDLARAAHLAPGEVWRVSGLLLASFHLAIIVATFFGRRRVRARGESQIGGSGSLLTVYAIGSFLVLAQVLTAVGFFSGWLFFVYLLNLLWLLLMAAYAFILALVEKRGQIPA